MGKSYVTINESDKQDPFEVFISTAKAGTDISAISEAIGRLVSFVLRIASPVAPRERLAEVVRQLDGIGGSRSLGFGPNRVRSLPDGVSRALANYLAEANPVPAGDVESTGAQLEMKLGDLCAECGEAAVVNEEGCRKCYSCGHSEC